MVSKEDYPNLPDRQAVVAGRFYPASKSELQAELNELFTKVSKMDIESSYKSDEIRAIISPHAGYVFSGIVAASAFSPLKNRKDIRRIFLIGSSHHAWFEGASVYYDASYITPLGKVEVDTNITKKLLNTHTIIEYHPEAHTNEHCLEVQLPFLQYILESKFKIVPIILGTQSIDTPHKLAEILRPYFTPENLFVVSTDLSHYPEYNDAIKIDKMTIDAICINDPNKFIEQVTQNEKKHIPNLATSVCGWTSVLTLLHLTKFIKATMYHPILYQNSGDIALYGEKTRVVGYQSIVVTVPEPEDSESQFLTDEEKKILLKHARESIANYLKDIKTISLPEESLPRALKRHNGAFVSIYVDGDLRGCIGRLEGDEAIYFTIEKMSVASASHDSRFVPIRTEELDNLHIEISVLSPLRKISSIREIIPGKHGILIRKDFRSGTFLPQVAEKTGWGVEELLSECSDRKAGLGRNGWKEAEIFIYEAEVFTDKT